MSKYQSLTISDEDLAKLDDLHDDVHVFRGRPKSPWLCIVRRPTFAETQAYKAMANDPAKKPLANVKLVTAISVFPAGNSPEWKAQFDRWPFFPDGLSDTEDFKDFVGLSIAENEK